MTLDEFEMEDLRNQHRFEKWLQMELFRHPDPRDPDHPIDCEEDEED